MARSSVSRAQEFAVSRQEGRIPVRTSAVVAVTRFETQDPWLHNVLVGITESKPRCTEKPCHCPSLFL